MHTAVTRKPTKNSFGRIRIFMLERRVKWK